jgi:hypothetical protein
MSSYAWDSQRHVTRRKCSAKRHGIVEAKQSCGASATCKRGLVLVDFELYHEKRLSIAYGVLNILISNSSSNAKNK